MKKMINIYLVVVLFIFLLPSINALEFDNRIRDYDEETRTIIIDDNFGLGGDLVRIKLEDNTYVCGIDCSAIWNVTIYDDEDNFLGDLVFEQIEGIGGVGEHKFEFVSGYERITVNEYGVDCGRRDDSGRCARVITGTHEEQKPIWTSFNPERKLPVGEYIIRLSGKKQFHDTIDWIPTFYGKEVREWAFWASSPPTSYWKFNEANRATEAIDDLGLNNLTLLDLTLTGFVPGKLANAWNGSFGAGAPEVLNHSGSSQFAFGTDDFTIAYWVNGTVGGGYSFMRTDDTATTGWGISKLGPGNHSFGSNNAAVLDSALNVSNSSWNRIVWVREGTGSDEFKVYVNNRNTANTTFANDLSDASGNLTIRVPTAGFVGIDDLQFYNGFAWSVADVDFDWNSGVGREANITTPEITISLDTPADNTNIQVDLLNFSATATPITANLTNSSLIIYNGTTTIFNQSSLTMDSSSNSTNYSIFNLVRGTYLWNIQICGLANNASGSSICIAGVSNRTLTIASSPIDSSFPEFTYETAQETFQENVTLLPGDTVTSVDFIYNGTSNTATSTLISGNNFTLQSTIDIPTSAISENTTDFFFSLNLNTGQDNLSTHTHSVGVINLSLFGQGIGGLGYINFTFQNETTAQEKVNATFSSTWSYFLGSGAINKTFTFVNSSENAEYVFQFHPQNRTLFTDMTTDYSNGESQQRTFDPTLLTLTNTTLLQTLLLLPTSDGLFQQFVTQTLLGATVPDVSFVINRSIGGVSTEISSGATDGSGFASIFLNPDFTYTAIFTKILFSDNAFSFQPSSQLRTVVMGGATTAVTNGSTISVNTTFLINPTNTSLANGTDFVFSFNVTSSQPIDLISMNITNSSGFQVGFQSDTSATIISQTINTGENRTFVGTFIIATGNETLVVKKVWNIGIEFVGDYSIFRQFTLYTTYGFRDFIRFILVLSFIAGVLIFMTTGETFDTSESKIGVALLLIWAFSIVGWLTIPGPPVVSANEAITELARFSNQYGIAILSSGAGIFFIARRIFT